MEKVKLRGHHVGNLVFHLKSRSWLERNLTNFTTTLLYGPKFYRKTRKMLQQLNLNSKIEIVKGVDDLCKSGCPYYTNCSNGDYRYVSSKFKRKMGLLEVEVTIIADPDALDKNYLRKYNLEVGKTYTLDELLRK